MATQDLVVATGLLSWRFVTSGQKSAIGAMTEFTFDRSTTNTNILAWKSPGQARGVQIAAFISDVTDTMSFTLATQGWPELQLLFALEAATETGTAVSDQKSGQIVSNVLTDPDLIGALPAELIVSIEGYSFENSTWGQDEFTVIASPGSADPSTVVLDNTAGTLTFDASYDGMNANYDILSTEDLEVLGGPNSTAITNVSFAGKVGEANSAIPNGYYVEIPSLTPAGNFSWGAGQGENPITIDFNVITAGNNQSGILLKRLEATP